MNTKLRYVLIALLFVLLALVEHCTGPLWWSCNPPYLLCAVTVCAMFSGEKSASLFGLVVGLFADTMTAGLFGVRAILFLFFGYMIAFLEEKILSRNLLSCLLAGVVSVAVSELAFWGIAGLSYSVFPASAAQYVLLPRIAMSVPVLLLLYGVFFLLYREQDSSPTARRR